MWTIFLIGSNKVLNEMLESACVQKSDDPGPVKAEVLEICVFFLCVSECMGAHFENCCNFSYFTISPIGFRSKINFYFNSFQFFSLLEMHRDSLVSLWFSIEVEFSHLAGAREFDEQRCCMNEKLQYFEVKIIKVTKEKKKEKIFLGVDHEMKMKNT